LGQECINIKESGNVSQIRKADILYLEALKDYTRIVTLERKHCILDSLGNLLHKTFLILLSEYIEAMPYRSISSVEKAVMK
jgi:DNA-binding LytR/AlgR family response regulator